MIEVEYDRIFFAAIHAALAGKNRLQSGAVLHSVAPLIDVSTLIMDAFIRRIVQAAICFLAFLAIRVQLSSFERSKSKATKGEFQPAPCTTLC